MTVNFKLEGLDQLQSKLDLLANPKKAKSIARKAARQAMNIVRDAARQKAMVIDDSETKEKIFKNIKVSGGKSKNPNNIVMRVGVDGGASFSNPNPPRKSGGDTRHWRWIEYGRSGVPAVPFMRPALESNIQTVTDKFSQVFMTELNQDLAL